MRDTKKLDFNKLVGFEAMSDQLKGRLDFWDETFSDKLGAKVGPPEPDGQKVFQDANFAARLGAKVGEPEDV